MSINVGRQNQQMNFTIVDNAWPTDANQWKKDAAANTTLKTIGPEGGEPVGGVNGGMELVKTLCQDVKYSSNDDGNTVWLSFKGN